MIHQSRSGRVHQRNTKLFGQRIFRSGTLGNQAMITHHAFGFLNGFEKSLSNPGICSRDGSNVRAHLQFPCKPGSNQQLQCLGTRGNQMVREYVTLEDRPTNIPAREFSKVLLSLPHLHSLILAPCMLCYFSRRVRGYFSPVATHRHIC
jgi:hypothetical protein